MAINDEYYNRVLQERRDSQQQQQEEIERNDDEQEAVAEVEPEVTEKAPEDYNLGDNVKELGGAIVGGGIDIYNSVGSLPKLFDKRFYQPTDPENPWKYDAPWLIKGGPITKTRWGGFIRGGTELAGGLVGTGKVLWGIKGLKGLATTAKATRMGRVLLSGTQGATYDFISNQSQEKNLARSLIDIKPQWAGVLNPIATKEDMSPAMKSMFNIGEGLGIGGLFDIATEGAGWGLRSYSESIKKSSKKIIKPDPITKAIDASSDVEYANKTQVIESGAIKSYENARKRSKQKRPPWKKLPKEQKEQLKQLYADKNNMDWGPIRDVNRRAIKQGKANKDLALEQLEHDFTNNSSRVNPAYNKGGDISDNQALSSSSKPMKGVRDMIQIRNDPTQKYGSPRGTITEATIRRNEYQAPGMLLRERDALAKKLVADPAYQKVYGEAMPEAIAEDLGNAGADLIRFVNDSGHSRLIDIPQEDVIKYVKDKDAGRPTVIEGIGVLNKSQLIATDTVLGQLLYESRDLAKAALSVADEIDVAAPGGLLDGILSRYSSIARMRKETSMLSSFELRKWNSGGKLKDTVEQADIRGKASDAVANEVATFKQLLQGDVDDDLLESFIHFTATSNGNKQTWKDLDAFFKRQLHGYKNGDQYQRNAILNEMQRMGVNSMLSGPKTPVRALIGTGLGTVMRPVATVLGATDDLTRRGAFQSLGAMVEARNDAWKKAIADFQSYNIHEEGWRGLTQSKKDIEWNSMTSWMKQYGSFGDRAAATIADNMRELNKLPVFNYGPRIMKSMDTYFTQLIGRGRLRQLAFDEVYTKAKSQNMIISDADMDELIKAAEIEFEGKVFTADGQVSDEMAKFSADEAKLTQELKGFAKDLDLAFDKMPFLRPFFLFAKTGVNALAMTSKYTPILNRFIREHSDISRLPWDAPELAQYGIKSQRDLELAQSVMRGRMTIGYGVTSTAALMALSGNITGNGPPDRQLKNSWLQAGWQPRSIKIGETYVSYEALEPFNMFFSFIADVVDSQKVMGDEWASNWFSKAAYLLSANVTNKSFLAGLLQLQDLLTSQGGDAAKVAANFANNQVPLAGLRNEIGKVLSPGMRELESGFWQSIGNRNLYIDLKGDDGFLPYRYDILNGKKLRDWDPMTRLVNGVLPINLNVGTNETREMLFRSGINFKQTFNTGPQGQDLTGYPELKSKFQFFIGQQNIEAKLEKLFQNPQIIDSIIRMERDRAEGRSYDPSKNLHGDHIRLIFREAKINAWALVLESNPIGQALDHRHKMGKLEDTLRRQGKYKKADNIYKQVKKFDKEMNLRGR